MAHNGIPHTLTLTLLCCSLNAYSSVAEPEVTLKANSSPKITISENGEGTVQYILTNTGTKSHHLSVRPIQGLVQETGKTTFCDEDIHLLSGKSCTLSFVVKGSELTPIRDLGPILCEAGWQWSDEAGFAAGKCIQPIEDDRLNINLAIISEPFSMVLKTTDTLTGQNTFHRCAAGGCTVTLFQGTQISRSLLITNTSSVVVNNVQAIGLPKDVTQNVDDCKQLKPNKTCHLIFTSGATRTIGKEVIIKGKNTPGVTITMSVDGIGDAYGGGKVACLSADLQSQLVAANPDASNPITWGGFSRPIGHNAQSPVNGIGNTQAIVDALGNNGGSAYAAKDCYDYSIDSKGNSPCKTGNVCYNDWFLPAKNQLDCLWMNRDIIGGFIEAPPCWSSTESTSQPNAAWAQSFDGTGEQLTSSKVTPLNVRCVRAIPLA